MPVAPPSVRSKARTYRRQVQAQWFGFGVLCGLLGALLVILLVQ